MLIKEKLTVTNPFYSTSYNSLGLSAFWRIAGLGKRKIIAGRQLWVVSDLTQQMLQPIGVGFLCKTINPEPLLFMRA